jgi:penicillin-binding protein-related factor A (putative recombinase)
MFLHVSVTHDAFHSGSLNRVFIFAIQRYATSMIQNKKPPRAIRKLKIPMRKEKDIELEVLLWLNSQRGCFAWKNKSMGTFNAKRGVYLRPTHRFSEKGSSDILGIWQGYMLCIEVKSQRGKLMPHQELFLDRINELGAIAFVARSLDDVKAHLIEAQILKIQNG